MQDLTLDSLAGGGAIEQFHRELDRVLANIRDPNTDPKAVRKVTLKVLIKPNEARDSAAVAVDVTAHLANPRRLGSQIFIGERGGKTVAVTHDPRQGDMFRTETDADGVVRSIRRTS